MSNRRGGVRARLLQSLVLALCAPFGEAAQGSSGSGGTTFEESLAEGSRLEDRRQNKQAAFTYRRAAQLASAEGRPADEAWARARECRAWWGGGDLEKAKRVCQEALAMARRAPSGKAEAEAEKGLGILDLGRGDYESAERRLLRAADLATSLDEDEILISSLNNLSVAALDRGRIDEAIAYSSRALAASEAFPDTSVRMQFAVPYNLAKALEASGDEESARAWLDRAARSAEATGFGGGLHHVLLESAGLLLRAGDLDGASDYFERAIAWNQAAPDLEEDVALARQGHASTLEARGQIEAALREYLEALKVFEKPGREAASVRTRIAVGRCLATLGRFEAADRELAVAETMARRMGLHVAEELARLERARVLDSRGGPESEASLSRSGDRLAALGLSGEAARAHLGAARAAERRGDRARALEWTLLALSEVELVRANLPAELRWRFLETVHEAYAAAYRLRMHAAGSNEGRSEAMTMAFETIERERSRDLADSARVSLRPAFSREGSKDPEARLDRIQIELLAELPDARRKALLREQADAQRDILLEERGASGRRWTEPKGRATDHRAALEPEEAVLTYTLDEPASLFIATRSGLTVTALRGGPDLKDQVLFFSTLLAQGEPAHAHQSGVALSRALLAPALALLPRGITRLMVAATGDISDLPFGALPHPADGRPLLEHYEVAYIPSLRFIAALREEPPPAGKGAMVLSDPRSASAAVSSARGAMLGPLPHALEEGREVAAYFPTRLLLEGAAATPRAVFDQGSRYSALHFAAHAVTDRQAPMNSALVLSPESASRTGWMTAREIYALNLDAALVTLSSCRSSAGPKTRASTAPSLARAFLYTGSRAVVAGLWDVDDAATRDLMSAFYRELSEGRTVGAAMNRAQRAMARSRGAAHWAGFQVIGDPQAQVTGVVRRPHLAGWEIPLGIVVVGAAAALMAWRPNEGPPLVMA
ncbi:MAG: CHAT domain-containing protein [Vicinamibacteria bacterium]|nr:CHAT domain-containing protein [Vicinamibacteria bacterium]